MKKLKVIYVADELTDYDGLAISHIESHFRKQNISMKKINWTFFTLQRNKPHNEVLIEIADIIRNAHTVFFDYGGFDICGSDNYRLIDYYSRFFMKIIEERPSINWICVSALPRNCFDEEDINKLKNIGVKFTWT